MPNASGESPDALGSPPGASGTSPDALGDPPGSSGEVPDVSPRPLVAFPRALQISPAKRRRGARGHLSGTSH
jgi:hypothetical protein